MLTYEQWDAIADAYIPCLVAILFAQIAYTLFLQQYVKLAEHLITTLISVVAVYMIGYLDKLTQLWPSLGLDYSTHTGLAFVLVIAIGKYKLTPCSYWHYLLLSSFGAYLLLMKWMNYHTILDMLTTFLCLLVLSLLLNYGAYKMTKCYRTRS